MIHLPRRDQLRHRVPTRTGDYSRWLTTQIQPPDWRYDRDRDFYTYCFKPPQAQRDLLLRCINKTIREFMHGHEHGVAMCNTNFQVVQTKKTPIIWPPRGSKDTTVRKFYTFMQDHEEFPATVEVSVMPPKGPLTARIHVRVKSGWTPIQTWLIELAESSRAIWARSPERIQYYWHKRNGRTFDFAKLPEHVRRIVLQYAMASEGEIYPLSSLTKTAPLSWSLDTECSNNRIIMSIGYTGGHSRYMSVDGDITPYLYQMAPEVHRQVSPPNTNLLLVSKWLTAEALEAGWNTPVKCFVDADNFALVSSSTVHIVQKYNVLGRIELSFTMSGCVSSVSEIAIRLLSVRKETLKHIT